MRITLPNALVAALLASALLTPSFAADSAATEERMARLEARLVEMEARLAAAEKAPAPAASSVSEARIAELETRLAEAEQETKEVKVLAANSASNESSILGNKATFDILANSAWRNLRWTEEDQWAEIRPGVSMSKVIEALGSPPRSVDSLKPRVDEVFYYETSIRADKNALRGKVSFRGGKVLTVQKPNFKANKSAQ
ncbi:MULTISPECIES: hypothetical protein [unclassified Lentimonas]|uniref:hypothetical protein n=1 Tax=unclassified Lentimonas TaxID=2630993 RepID=UPI00132098B7|nr:MULTISPECIES: hypothetical protein [unclassified Lentimonas]CAA6676622.1 Unannotated [Lentimonas sp. CC4]CAA6684715.1 Unannotated [Lentimonas sp. CC6]CAA7075351.1 Unannotated [Lentimonas sp. CC4]CAA7170961.1 Unannotated [Lentimonas sp. CC21]CAA7182240.1 Unannotated [Lentimonas sp. CC8]